MDRPPLDSFTRPPLDSFVGGQSSFTGGKQRFSAMHDPRAPLPGVVGMAEGGIRTLAEMAIDPFAKTANELVKGAQGFTDIAGAVGSRTGQALGGKGGAALTQRNLRSAKESFTGQGMTKGISRVGGEFVQKGGLGRGLEAAKEAAGIGAQIGVALGSGGLGEVGVGIPGLAGIGARTLARGTLPGLLFGAGSAMAQPKSTPGEVLGGAGIGAGIGTLTAGAGETFKARGEVRRAFTKNFQDVINTPEDKVYKLSASDRRIWFENRAKSIKQSETNASQQAKAELRASAERITKESEKLQRDLQVASRDKVIELRPKIVKAMGAQSKIYRNLIDEELSNIGDKPINKGDLAGFVEKRYGDSPNILQAIKDKLGIGHITTEGIPTIQQGEDTTLRELFEQTKLLRQDISHGARLGTKSFTPDDKLTDDAIHTLTDYMKEKGIDFTEANRFWAEYAPIRNQLVSEARPFLRAETRTETFANTLIQVAQGKDVNNENFIKEVENLLGEPITKEHKAILSALDVNEKSKIAAKIAYQQRIMEAKMETGKAMERLSIKQFEAERRAGLRSLVKKLLFATGGTIIGGGIGVQQWRERRFKQ